MNTKTTKAIRVSTDIKRCVLLVQAAIGIALIVNTMILDILETQKKRLIAALFANSEILFSDLSCLV